MAAAEETERWRGALAPDLETFEILVVEAYAGLPEAFRTLCGDIRFLIAEFPEEDVLTELQAETEYDILGLFEGRGIGELATPMTGEMPNRILLYRRPILDYWAENEETLGAIVRHVLIHEIGHHFGLSDDDMQALEAEAD